MKFHNVAVRFVLPAMLALTVGSSDAAPAAATIVLNGTVGPGATITLKKTNGTKVTTLKKGTYQIKVSDKAANHNFHLTGPSGFNKMTTVAQKVNVVWNVTLKVGTYNYKCDPHASIMKGSFTVTN